MNIDTIKLNAAALSFKASERELSFPLSLFQFGSLLIREMRKIHFVQNLKQHGTFCGEYLAYTRLEYVIPK
jgi:hypothetical protein